MNPRPFVIFFQSRSGSTYLTSLLNSHDDVYCRFEDFHMITPNHVKRRLTTFSGGFLQNPSIEQTRDHLQKLFERPAKASGFKFKYPSQYARYPEIFLSLLQHREQLRVIHLDRANVVKRGVSTQHLIKLRERKELVSANLTEKIKSEKISIEIPRLLNFAEAELQMRNELRLIASQFPNLLTVEYDNLLQSRDRELRRITDFLGVEPFAQIESQFKKATSDDLSEVVENYDELCEKIAGTPYAYCLDQKRAA